MRRKHIQNHIKMLLITVSLVVLGAGTALAVTPQSENYEIIEPEFGAGSALEMCSGQYCASASIGDTDGSLGRSTSTSFSSGADVGDEPLLEVITEPGVSFLGTLSIDQPSYKTMTLKVRTYLSEGYIVQITGEPPRYDGHVLQAPSSPVASEPGTEQFAINAVANTQPRVGEDLVQEPSGNTSFGYVLPDYSTPNRFMYRSGDVIARSDSESGQTNYTISFIVNVANSTPAGHFSGDYAAIVTPRF